MLKPYALHPKQTYVNPAAQLLTEKADDRKHIPDVYMTDFLFLSINVFPRLVKLDNVYREYPESRMGTITPLDIVNFAV